MAYKYSDFKTYGLSTSNQPIYWGRAVGQCDSDRVKAYGATFMTKKTDDCEIFVSGEPVVVENENGQSYIRYAKISEGEKPIAICFPSRNIAVDLINKKSKAVVYRSIMAGYKMNVVIPDGEAFYYNALELVNFGQQITFGEDEDGIFGIKPAKSGDTVYGICISQSGIEAGKVGEVSLDFSNNCKMD